MHDHCAYDIVKTSAWYLLVAEALKFHEEMNDSFWNKHVHGVRKKLQQINVIMTYRCVILWMNDTSASLPTCNHLHVFGAKHLDNLLSNTIGLLRAELKAPSLKLKSSYVLITVYNNMLHLDGYI